MVPPDHALPHRAHEEDRPLPAPASGTNPQLLPGSKTDFQRGCGGTEQQGQSHHEKILRLPHVPSPRTGPLSLTWQAARARIYPRFLLTSQEKQVVEAGREIEDTGIFQEERALLREEQLVRRQIEQLLVDIGIGKIR